MSIFNDPGRIQPYVYPSLIKFSEAIQDTFWHVRHFSYEKDVRDYKIELSDVEREAVKRSMLSISVIENKVKCFWALIFQKMPHTEISDVGFTFAGNEVVHRQTYAKTLQLLDLEEEFSKIMDVTCMKGRVDYLNKYLKNGNSDKEFTKSLILFTLLVENASLFSQFLIVSSFRKYRNLFKNFGKVVEATAREEILHGQFGSALINIIRKENSEWFDEEMENKTRRAIRKAYYSEANVLDWIFEKGELEFISKAEVLEFLKQRLNNSLNQIGYSDEYTLDQNLLKKSSYMERMLLATGVKDFFDGATSDYNESTAITEESLWEN